VRKILILAIVLLAISIVTQGIAYAAAIRTEVAGTYSMTATAPGEIFVLKSGIMRQAGAEASGPIVSSDPRVTGILEIVLYRVVNLNTGKGLGFGSFTVSNAGGTFEGHFTVKDTGFVSFEGAVEGHGTGAYEGLLVKFDMTGTDLTLVGGGSISASFTGSILEP
jgi:hypothetical protein